MFTVTFMRLEANVAGPQTEFRCERDLAQQLMTKLLRMTANLMSAREAAARLEPVPPARAWTPQKGAQRPPARRKLSGYC